MDNYISGKIYNGRLASYIGNAGLDKVCIFEDKKAIQILSDKFEYDLKKKFDSFEKTNKKYYGYSEKQVLDTKKDILFEKAISLGEPSVDTLMGALPDYDKNEYGAFGGALSFGNYIIYKNGDVVLQDGNYSPVFTLNNISDFYSKENLVFQNILDEQLPIIISRYEKEGRILEVMYFVEPLDPSRDPLLWVRALEYNDILDSIYKNEVYYLSRNIQLKTASGTDLFYWDTFVSCVEYWMNFYSKKSTIKIPEKHLEKHINATFGAIATTFSGEHMHYGKRAYAWEIHDHFPPNFLSYIELLFSYGYKKQASDIMENVFKYVIDFAGRFSYRQGASLPGASGSEYGQWLWLVERVEGQICDKLSDEYINKLILTGRFLISNKKPIEDCGGIELICMCAEADNNTKLFAYASNNLWAVIGLEALCKILKRYKRKEYAEFEKEAMNLNQNITAAMNNSKIKTRFGVLPAFRYDYMVNPLSLSICDEPNGKILKKDYKKYIDFNTGIQDLNENTYANYRYYLEMLSSFMINDKECDAILKLRKNAGGAVLNMTRFMSWLDDWPAGNLAKYFLSRDMTDDYLMLLYAHYLFHGQRQLCIYYEQVCIDGAVKYDDCVPSQALVSQMIAWMFVFEKNMDDNIYLGKGLAKKWFVNDFDLGAENLGSTVGDISINYKKQDGCIVIDLDLPKTRKNIFVSVRAVENISEQDIIEGNELVFSIKGNVIRLKKGVCKKCCIKIKV